MCAGAPAGAFSEPKIAPLGFSVPKIMSFCVFNIEMRLEGPFHGGWVDFSILGGPPGPFLSIFDGRVVKNRGPRNTDPAPGTPGTPGKVSQAPQLRATHPHAPGARMTVVKQTPSNKIFYLI